MSAHAISFHMTDALMSQAAREDCVAGARELAKPRNLLLILASTAIFVAALLSSAHPLWWLTDVPILLVSIMALVWVAAYLWLPRRSISRLARLSAREIRIEVSEKHLSFQTAAERLEVAWSELKALKRRTTFWFVCLKSGTRIPVPASVG